MFGARRTLVLTGAAFLGIMGAGIGGYFVGHRAGENAVQVKWDKATHKSDQEKIALQDRIITLQNQNETIKEKVRVEYVDRVNTITQTKYQNRDVIKEVFKDSPYLSKGWVYAHNQLVDGNLIDPSLASDKTPSKFTEEDSLRVIGENYSIARQGIAKDNTWNKFYEGISSNYRLAPNSMSGDNTNTTSPAASSGTNGTNTTSTGVTTH